VRKGPSEHFWGDGFQPEGEFVSIPERVVVSPTWGRFHGEALEAGALVPMGAVIGRIREGTEETYLYAPVNAAFVAWLVRDRERVRPGTALARLLQLDGMIPGDGLGS
jgi:hypothetical protein